jgi:hypothetical protein
LNHFTVPRAIVDLLSGDWQSYAGQRTEGCMIVLKRPRNKLRELSGIDDFVMAITAGKAMARHSGL